MENTAVRFSAKEKEFQNSIFGLYFIVKISILLAVVFSLVIFGEKIFIFMHKESIIKYLPFLIAGLIGESLFFINDTYLQAMQKFKLRSLINISRFVMAVSFIGILLLTKSLDLKYVFLVYLIPIFFSLLFIGKYVRFIKGFFSERLHLDLLKEVFNYQKWMLILSIANNILGRIDFFMLSFWVSFAQIGIYNAAFQLTSIVSFLPYVLGKVMLPKMAEQSSQETFNLVKKMIKPVLVLTFIMLALIPLSGPVVVGLLGDKYTPSIVILQILLLAFIFSFVILPFEQSLYSLGKPKLIALSKYFQLIIIVILNILTIPKYGILWAAINLSIARFITLAITAYLFFDLRRKYAA